MCQTAQTISIAAAARELAAALGPVGQTRSIPSTAEGLNQQYGIRHSTAQDIDLRDLIRERRSLRDGHFKVAGDPTLVASD